MNFEIMKEQLKAKGYKLTPQRRAILEIVLDKRGQHLSSEEIYDIVKVDTPDIGLATVYRTLQLLSDIDILSKMNLEDGVTRYEVNVDKDAHHHHHLICTECGKIIEVEHDLLEPLEEKVETDFNFLVKDHKLKFFGVCSSCQNQ